MEKFEVGEIIVVLFPFSDLKDQKVRPALVLANAEFNNIILCQITSKPYASKSALKLSKTDFDQGSLPRVSYIRPDKLFTAESSLIQKKIGKLITRKKKSVLTIMQKMFK
jgi:mRNA interferase MazF